MRGRVTEARHQRYDHADRRRQTQIQRQTAEYHRQGRRVGAHRLRGRGGSNPNHIGNKS